MTFYFIAGEPSSFMTMVNMAYLIKTINPDFTVEAIIPHHGFLAKMEVQEFLDEFDRVWHLPSCDFQRNILRGVCRGMAFKKAVKNIVFDENSIAFAFVSSEMSINLLIKYISDNYRSIKVFLLSYTSRKFDISALGGRLSRLLTFLNRFYSFMFGCYPMQSYTTANGQFMYREHCQRLPFSKIVLIHQAGCNTELEPPETGQIMLPYPAVQRYKMHSDKQEKIVIYFGDITITDYYVQLDKQFLIKKNAQYVNAVRDYYDEKNIRVYYKPHPFDGEKIMPGCESAGLPIFKERINAEMLFSKYHDDIVAVYAISSHSVLFGSKYGIPSYWAHEICFTDEDLKISFRNIALDNNSMLLKSLTCFDQIGSIDDHKINIDMAKMLKDWENGVRALVNQ